MLFLCFCSPLVNRKAHTTFLELLGGAEVLRCQLTNCFNNYISMQVNHRITETLILEKTTMIIQSNHGPITPVPTKNHKSWRRPLRQSLSAPFQHSPVHSYTARCYDKFRGFLLWIKSPSDSASNLSFLYSFSSCILCNTWSFY